MKAALGQTTKEDHYPVVENFLFSVFAKIDKEDRTDPLITKVHALGFKRCADFIQILTMFNPLEQEWQERAKFCNFKAGIILKCLKNGEVPPRGNPFVNEEESLPAESQEDDSSAQIDQQYEEVKQPAASSEPVNMMGGYVTPNPAMMPQYANPVVMPEAAPYQPPAPSMSYPGQGDEPFVSKNPYKKPAAPVNPPH
jgi:vacuolar protein sorting-associated protein VTA1